MLKVFMAGGGSGGHLFPGISLAEALRDAEPDIQVRFLISGKRLDAALLENRGFSCEKIEQRALPRSPGRIFDFTLTNARALFSLIRLMLREQPDVLVGLGGYASFAAGAAAKVCGVPVVLLEQNVIPGKANRALSIAADRVFCQWRQAAKYFLRRDNLCLSGNPVRRDLKKMAAEAAREKLNLRRGKRTLLVLGGSQGARALNDFMIESLPVLREFKDAVQIVHLTGRTDVDRVRAGYARAGMTACVRAFLEEMQTAYSAADLVLCRAGGTTIAEITALGLPSILVPYPHSAQNHQLANARELARAGAAVLLEEKELSGEKMRSCVLQLLSSEEKLTRMALESRLLGRPDAASRIASSIIGRYRTKKIYSATDTLEV